METRTDPSPARAGPGPVIDRLLAPAVRASLGLLFVWFGVLKVSGDTPVAELVTATLPWADAGLVLPLLGWFEIALGCALVVGRPRRLALLVAAGHLAGTFLAFVQAPSLLMSGGNPFLLTATGEFVVKNLVLVCVALLLLRHHDRPRDDRPRDGRPRDEGS